MTNTNESNSLEPTTNSYRRRASDTYVPISLMLSTVGILSGLWGIINPLINNQIDILNRLTKLETTVELCRPVK